MFFFIKFNHFCHKDQKCQGSCISIFGRFYYLEYLQILSSKADLFGHERLQIELFQITQLLCHLKAHLYELYIILSLQVEIQKTKMREKGHHAGQTAIL